MVLTWDRLGLDRNKSNSARIANKLLKDKWELVGQRTPLGGGWAQKLGIYYVCSL